MRHWQRNARAVLCTGLQSSGSTWLFNVVAELLRREFRDRSVAQLFADEPAGFPDDATEFDYLVVKSHRPRKSLMAFAALTDAPVLTAVREPRDAVASLVKRFSLSFAHAQRVVTASAAALVQRSRGKPALLLKYEDRFFDDTETVMRLASFLGLGVSRSTAVEIFDQFTPQQVMRQITELQQHAETTHSATHWHPHHIGDREVGKFRDVLSRAQQAQVALVTRVYCQEFGYSATLQELDTIISDACLTLKNCEDLRAAAEADADFVFTPRTAADANSRDWPVGIGSDGRGILYLLDGDIDAPARARTGGFSIRVSDVFEQVASGKQIRIRVIARAALGAAAARFAIAYSTNEVGNSGWHWFDVTSQWSLVEMAYSVPRLKEGNGDFIGLLPGAPGTPGVEVCLVAAVTEP